MDKKSLMILAVVVIALVGAFIVYKIQTPITGGTTEVPTPKSEASTTSAAIIGNPMRLKIDTTIGERNTDVCNTEVTFVVYQIGGSEDATNPVIACSSRVNNLAYTRREIPITFNNEWFGSVTVPNSCEDQEFLCIVTCTNCERIWNNKGGSTSIHELQEELRSLLGV